MANNKEAMAIVLDVGPSMNQAPPGEDTSLQTSIQAINMILQRKMFAESKDEIALILFGTNDTANEMAELDDESYQNITVARPLGSVDWDLLQYVLNDINPGNQPADFIDALVVAMDTLVKGVQGKRGFGSKRIVLFSDLAGEFTNDQLADILGSFKEQNIEFNLIGPDLDEDEDDEEDAKPGTSNGMGKEKTPQQRAGEEICRQIIDKVDGASYSFNEALPALSYFQSRQVRSVAWKCQLTIGTELAIPIAAYHRVKEAKAKSFKNVYAREPDSGLQRERTYHLNDDAQTEIDKPDVVDGHRYGSTLVPFSEDDKEAFKYTTEKSFKVLGFTKAENIKRHHLLGDFTMSVVAEKGDSAAAVALSALVRALYETGTCAVVRRVYAANSAVKLGCLQPHITADHECLYYNELPFAEDLRTFQFGSLPTKDENTGPNNKKFAPSQDQMMMNAVLGPCLYYNELPFAEDLRTFQFGSLPTKDENTGPNNKKFAPSQDQLDAIDGLIDNMDLMKADPDGEEDDDGDCEATEALKPKLLFNPYLQRLYQCLQHRALHPEDPLPELSPLIASNLKRPEVVETSCQASVEKCKEKFKLVRVEKKDEKTGEKLFKDDGEGDAPAAKKPKMDDNLDGGLPDIIKAKVTEVGTVTPVDDFRALIAQKDEDKFEEACKMLQKVILQIIMDSFGSQSYSKAIDCVKALRVESIKNGEPDVFNDYIREFKETLASKGKSDFWNDVSKEQLGLISKIECEQSKVSKEEAEAFLESKDEAAEEEEREEDQDMDDLMDEL